MDCRFFDTGYPGFWGLGFWMGPVFAARRGFLTSFQKQNYRNEESFKINLGNGRFYEKTVIPGLLLHAPPHIRRPRSPLRTTGNHSGDHKQDYGPAKS